MAIFIIIGVIVLLYIVIDWERQNKPNNMKYPTEYKYDERGNKIEWNSYYYNGRLSSKTTYKYNPLNQKIEENNFKPDGSLISRSKFNYDENGNNIDVHFYGSDGCLRQITTSKYNYFNKKIEETYYDSDNCLCIKRIYTYDEIGNEIESCSYDSNGHLTSRCKILHDEKGNTIRHENTRFELDGKVQMIEISEFDENGIGVDSICYNGAGIQIPCQWDYDEYGRLKKKIPNPIIKYDAKNNKIEETFYDGMIFQNWHKTLYKYNENNKLIEEISTSNATIGDRNIEFQTLYKYNSTGDLIEKLKYIIGFNEMEGGFKTSNYSKILKYKETIKFYDKGKYKEETHFDYNGLLKERETFEINIKGVLREKNTYNSENILIEKMIREYDESDRMIEEQKYVLNSDGVLILKSRYKK